MPWIDLLWCLAFALFYGLCTDVQETIYDRFERSIFKNLGPWWKSDWRRRYHGHDPTAEPKKVLGIPLAGHLLSGWVNWFYDAWHLFKGLKLLALGLLLGHLLGLTWPLLASSPLLFVGVVGAVHQLLYMNLFRKP